MVIELFLELAIDKGILRTKAIVETMSNVQFEILMESFTDLRTVLSKIMRVGTIYPKEVAVLHTDIFFDVKFAVGGYTQRNSITSNEDTVAISGSEMEEMDLFHVPEEYLGSIPGILCRHAAM